jgi:large subunit ribosomal protein L21
VYAVFETGGKQYKVSPGELIKVEKLNSNPGSEVQFEKVLMVQKEDGTMIGHPYLDNVRVVGEVLEHKKGEKIIVFKYKRRKNYRRKKGHRQWYTALRIKEITV